MLDRGCLDGAEGASRPAGTSRGRRARGRGRVALLPPRLEEPGRRRLPRVGRTRPLDGRRAARRRRVGIAVPVRRVPVVVSVAARTAGRPRRRVAPSRRRRARARRPAPRVAVAPPITRRRPPFTTARDPSGRNPSGRYFPPAVASARKPRTRGRRASTRFARRVDADLAYRRPRARPLARPLARDALRGRRPSVRDPFLLLLGARGGKVLLPPFRGCLLGVAERRERGVRRGERRGGRHRVEALVPFARQPHARPPSVVVVVAPIGRGGERGLGPPVVVVVGAPDPRRVAEARGQAVAGCVVPALGRRALDAARPPRLRAELARARRLGGGAARVAGAVDAHFEPPRAAHTTSRRLTRLGSPNLRASCAVIFPASSGRLLGDGGGTGTGFDGVADALRGPSCPGRTAPSAFVRLGRGCLRVRRRRRPGGLLIGREETCCCFLRDVVSRWMILRARGWERRVKARGGRCRARLVLERGRRGHRRHRDRRGWDDSRPASVPSTCSSPRRKPDDGKAKRQTKGRAAGTR